MERGEYETAILAHKYIGDVLLVCQVYDRWMENAEGEQKTTVAN